MPMAVSPLLARLLPVTVRLGVYPAPLALAALFGLLTTLVFALWPLVRPWWGRLVLVSYPVLMLFATVVTGNHYFLDAVGGWGALGLGYALARWRDWWPWERARRERQRPTG